MQELEKIYFSIKDGSIRTDQQLEKMYRSKIEKIQMSVAHYYECSDETFAMFKAPRRVKRAYQRKLMKMKFGKAIL